MPSILKPLLFLGSCVFCCTTSDCPGCEKNVNCEPLLFNFLTNTYLSTLRAYTCGSEGRKEKQQGDILKGILEIKWPKEVLIYLKSYSQIGTKLGLDHSL